MEFGWAVGLEYWIGVLGCISCLIAACKKSSSNPAYEPRRGDNERYNSEFRDSHPKHIHPHDNIGIPAPTQPVIKSTSLKVFDNSHTARVTFCILTAL